MSNLDPTKGVRLAILGDFHYHEKDNALYEKARHQILEFSPDAIACLGDLGRGVTCGTSQSFQDAKDYFLSFDKPYYPLIGNHDLESNEFQTDAEAVSRWTKCFDLQNHYYAVDLEHTLLLFLSSVYHRENQGSPHEVCLEEEQIEWFQKSVKDNKDRPIFIFSHAPVLGSHIKILQNLHLKVPNAWTNHMNQPERFIEIIKNNPQVKLWFSAHNHLGQYYKDSVGKNGSCLFVHTGVISSVTRDGFHHSRFLEFGDQGCVLSTIDHDLNQCSVDLLYDFKNNNVESYTKFIEDQQSSFYSPPPFPKMIEYQIEKSIFVIYHHELVEFDLQTHDALGVVEQKMEHKTIEIKDNRLYIILKNGQKEEVFNNRAGRFYKIFSPHPQVIKEGNNEKS